MCKGQPNMLAECSSHLPATQDIGLSIGVPELQDIEKWLAQALFQVEGIDFTHYFWQIIYLVLCLTYPNVQI